MDSGSLARPGGRRRAITSSAPASCADVCAPLAQRRDRGPHTARLQPRSRVEQETIIRFDDESGMASVYTASSRVAARWRRRGVELAERHGGFWGEVPKTRVRIAKPSVRKKNAGSFQPVHTTPVVGTGP